MQKSNEAWNAFFSLLRLKKQGKLPPYMNHISPPGYWKDKGTGRRKLLLVVRQDRYVVDEQRHVLILKDFKMAIRFTGRLRWFGSRVGLRYITMKQGMHGMHAYQWRLVLRRLKREGGAGIL